MIGFAAYSGTGKTTLLLKLIPLLTARGLRLAVIKHSHHDFEIDEPGKDSYELHHAGSEQTLLTSKYRSALITENHPPREPVLSEQVQKLDLSEIDLVLVEGFRHESSLTRIELHRPALGKPFLFSQDQSIIALASDEPLEIDIPLLDINNPAQIADFVIDWMSA
jgi:molybdopterin-guanine dinucleotide biosynthesis protein B